MVFTGQAVGGVSVYVDDDDEAGKTLQEDPTFLFFFFVSVRCNTCTNTVCPPVFLNIEGSCVLYCREWKMPFTLWYGRSGCTGSISSARKKRLRAVSSLKSVL